MGETQEAYEFGAQTAREVQAALAEGKTWDDSSIARKGFPPERAMQVRELWKKSGDEEFVAYYDGYLSRWD